MRLRTSLSAIIAIVLIMAGGWAFSQTRSDARTPLAEAMDTIPADTRVAGFTDWAGIRTTLGFGTVRSKLDRTSIIDSSFKRDLSARSVLQTFTEEMQGPYGWSMADTRWEMYAQGSKGALLSVGLNEDLGSATVTKGLSKLGYRKTDGIWAISADALSAAIPSLPSAFLRAAYFPRENLIYFSDGDAYLRKAVADHNAHGPTLAGVPSARMAAEPLVGSLSAVISVRGDSCKDTGVSGQPADVRAQARNIVKPFGTLSPYEYGGRALFDDGDDAHLTFSMAFDSAALATSQIALRRQLTTGPYLGLTGRLEDVLQLRSTHTDGPAAWLDFGFDSAKASFMNGDGPLLFATCAA